MVTFTACGSFTASAANATINVEYGTAAGGTNRVTNPAAGTYTVSITAASDTGSYAVAVISNDIVNITATVDPTITFSVSDNAIGFGTLSTSAARFATGDANGSSSDSSAAFTMTIAVNTGKGYTISYNGATLTSSGNTVTVADITNDADGTSGSEQFGMGFSTDGAATIATGYDHNATAGNRDWKFVASTTTTIASETTEAGSETISAFLLTNIATATEPGSYTTNVTFVASGVY